ncbi:MAG: hypothetical protein QM516_08995, partial [Limnohabitans sp.]|nr:hypothetical protein [Limnohabitans sp.]
MRVANPASILALACSVVVALPSTFAGPPDLSLDRNAAVIVPPSVLIEGDPFRQLDEVLPTPNDFRTASGAPGPRYWQQKVDHEIEVELDPSRAEITGKQRIVYHNNAPEELRYLWVQLDQNRFRRDSLGERAEPAPDLSQPQDIRALRNLVEQSEWEGGYRDVVVLDDNGAALPSTIVDTMMRIDLPKPLASGASIAFRMSWRFSVVKNTVTRARSNYELLGEGDVERKDADLAPLYVVAQFFPRLAPYNDVRGWQHKQFLGQGEFALEFGDYTLAVTVPDTWTVGASGELQNPTEVLTAAQRERLALALSDEKPRFITTPEEAAALRSATP